MNVSAGSAPRADGLHAEVQVRRPGHTLEVDLRVAPGEVVAVVGPNGSGKTTLLRALAGLQPLTAGSVRWGTEVWESSTARLDVRRRGVGVVFQDLLLFPHLGARDNVAYGPRARGAGRTAARATADAWLARLGVADLAERRPRQLSGGQAQRVALARALAAEPRLLLLDEPLSALDVAVASRLRVELGGHLRDFSGGTVLVTHDPVDAFALADRLVALDDGVVVQEGSPAAVARQPRTSHVARLVGVNLLSGVARGTGVEVPGLGEVHTGTAAHGAVDLLFPTTALTLSRDRPGGSARNVWRGSVVSVSPHGAAARVHLDIAEGLLADVTVESAAALGLGPGVEVWAALKATEVDVQGETTGVDPRLP